MKQYLHILSITALLLFTSLEGRLLAQGVEVHNFGLIYNDSASTLFIQGDFENHAVGLVQPKVQNYKGNIHLTGNWFNSGGVTNPLQDTKGKFFITGNQFQQIDGMIFSKLYVNGSFEKRIRSNTRVKDSLILSRGFINSIPNGAYINLDSTAYMIENDSNNIRGIVTFNKTVLASATDSLGGVGLIFSPNKNTGKLIIKRSTADSGQVSYLDSENPISKSVFRFFEVKSTLPVTANIDFRYWSNENFGAPINYRLWIKDTVFVKDGSISIDSSDWDSLGGISASSPKRVTKSSVEIPNSQIWLTISDAVNQRLPVDLIDFQAILQHNNDVKVSWATASELNNNYFKVERSVDGINWQFVEQVKGKGTTLVQHNYSILDKTAKYLSQKIVYYRLKQVDYDGSSQYSEVRKVIFNSLNRSGITIYPNPAIHNVQIDIQNQNGEISIVNALGKVVYKEYVNQNILLDISNFSNGVYFVKFQTNDGVVISTQKLIKE